MRKVSEERDFSSATKATVSLYWRLRFSTSAYVSLRRGSWCCRGGRPSKRSLWAYRSRSVEPSRFGRASEAPSHPIHSCPTRRQRHRPPLLRQPTQRRPESTNRGTGRGGRSWQVYPWWITSPIGSPLWRDRSIFALSSSSTSPTIAMQSPLSRYKPNSSSSTPSSCE